MVGAMESEWAKGTPRNETDKGGAVCSEPHKKNKLDVLCVFAGMRPPPLPWRAAAVARRLATLAADATGATHTPQARGPFATLTGADLAAFREVVGGAGMVTEAAGLEKYNR